MSELLTTLEIVKGRIEKYGSKGINEQDTKATLIQPVLRALGWDVEDLEDVQREYRRRSSDKPVDYALFLLRTPSLFVEAKALGQNLDDRRWANQIMGYASVAGVEWVVLTDGNEYRLYNSHATVPIEEKLFRVERIFDDAEKSAELLGLLSKNRIKENEINMLWKAHFVDRQVKVAVENLFADEPDPSIIRLVTRRVGTLTAGDVRASLRRAQVTFDFPMPPKNPLADTRHKTNSRTEPRKRRSKKKMRRIKRVAGLVYLQDIIQAGLLSPPVELYRRYRDHDIRATIREDGKVIFQDQAYDTPSTAAEIARGTITGRRMNTNGWSFWQYTDESGHLVELEAVRKAFRERKGQ